MLEGTTATAELTAIAAALMLDGKTAGTDAAGELTTGAATLLLGGGAAGEELTTAVGAGGAGFGQRVIVVGIAVMMAGFSLT